MIFRGQLLDRVASRVARGLLGWSARHAAPSRRGWVVARRHELYEIDGGWARLALAVDGLRLAWLPGAPAEQRGRHEWPESWSIVAGSMLLGLLAWIAFATHVPDPEGMPAEVLFGFLMLYFYAVGFLSGRRTGKTGTGSWAGAASGLAFGAVVALHMTVIGLSAGYGGTIRYGSPNQVAIAWSGLVFFLMLGAICGWLGARSAVRAPRQGRRTGH